MYAKKKTKIKAVHHRMRHILKHKKKLSISNSFFGRFDISKTIVAPIGS